MVIAAKWFIHHKAHSVFTCVWKTRKRTFMLWVKELSSLPIFVQVASNEISGSGRDLYEHKLRVMSFIERRFTVKHNRVSSLNSCLLESLPSLLENTASVCVESFFIFMLARALTRSVSNQKCPQTREVKLVQWMLARPVVGDDWLCKHSGVLKNPHHHSYLAQALNQAAPIIYQ